MPRRLQRSQWFARPRDEVFAFFADPRNLARITPPWLHFQVLTPGTIDLRAGTLIDYRIKVRGIPIRWQSEITVWEPSARFADVQKRGPYRLWHHLHRFEDRDGGTWMEDVVDYQAPGGWLEPLLQRWLVGPDLERIFDFRRQVLEEVLGK